MDFQLDDDHRMLQEEVRSFAENEIAPGAEERDRECRVPDALRAKMAEMGFFGIAVPTEYGGAGLGCLASCIVVEEVSRACAGCGVLVSAHNSLCIEPILLFGTQEQKQQFLPALASGETIGCLALTEPGSGTDMGAARCRAELKDDGWHLNGTKIFVTNGGEAGLTVVLTLTDPEAAKKSRRLSLLVVERDTPGLQLGKLEKKLGIRCSTTAEYVFEDCVVPPGNVLGERGLGTRQALTILDGGRIGIAAQALGIARACLDESAKYANTREQFGRPIGEFQAIQWKLSDMAVSIAASRELIYRAAWLKDTGGDYSYTGAMAKLFASETASRCANHAVQVFGGYGYCQDYPVERLLRDAKITEIYEGTSEVQRMVIARGVMAQAENNWEATV
ncbi:MAG: acyl-CoA dehydrogenase family protein [Planctomycetes bacterium]|nr:acyl-CoA dehydrogenase family protein [Planctomycetota bacterium]